MNRFIKSISPKNIVIICLMTIFFLLDRYLKNLILTLGPGFTKIIIKDLLSFNLIKNYNIAFSIPINGNWLTILISFIILGLIIINTRELVKTKKINLEINLLFVIIVGAISNLIDRYQYGYVVDYLKINHLFIFNLADFMITCGAAALLIVIFRQSSAK